MYSTSWLLGGNGVLCISTLNILSHILSDWEVWRAIEPCHSIVHFDLHMCRWTWHGRKVENTAVRANWWAIIQQHLHPTTTTLPRSTPGPPPAKPHQLKRGQVRSGALTASSQFILFNSRIARCIPLSLVHRAAALLDGRYPHPCNGPARPRGQRNRKPAKDSRTYEQNQRAPLISPHQPLASAQVASPLAPQLSWALYEDAPETVTSSRSTRIQDARFP